MATFNLDPSEGPHIASSLSNEELEFLQQVLAVELAIRLGKTDYEQTFRRIAERRTEMDATVSDWRRQRDRMTFVASVLSDLDGLPVLEEH